MATNKEIIRKKIGDKSAVDPEMGDYVRLMKKIDPTRRSLEADFNKKNPPTGNEERDYANMRRSVDPKVKEITRAESVRSVSQGIPPRTSANATSLKTKAAPKTLPLAIKTATSPNRFGSLGTTAKTTPAYIAPEVGKKSKLKEIVKKAGKKLTEVVLPSDKTLKEMADYRVNKNKRLIEEQGRFFPQN